MGYPQGAETYEEAPHDYRGYYPTHFLRGCNFSACDPTTCSGEVISERVGDDWHSVCLERRSLPSLLPLAEARLWGLVWRWNLARTHSTATSAQGPSGLV